MQSSHEFIPVTIDKSHIITIGERLYTESIEFIRELVNNAYDADATLVEIIVSEDTIEIRDNGSGMDREGLRQYFNIGSQQKLYSPKSPIYNRDRIGQFGIGKFASLSACKRFEVITKRDDFAGRVIFDKEQWEKTGDVWQLPLEILPPDFRKYNGITVLLTGLDRRFEPNNIEQKIIEGTPIKAPHFRVRINNHTVTPRSLSGHKIPFLEGTAYGPVSGEIIIVSETASAAENLGIEIKVKQVTVRRELFGMETWGKAMARVRGEVNADFLSITSDRTGFIKDSPEYQEFLKVMQKIMEGVKISLQKLTTKKESRKVSRALKEALQRIYKALAANPDLSPFGALPIGDETKGMGSAADVTKKEEGIKEEEVKTEKKTKIPEKKRKKKPKVKRLTPNAIIKKIKFGETGVSCVVDSFGEDGPEVFSEETTIYINRDHPLYKRESARVDTHTLNLARLITQEIALMKDPRNPRQAFERQSKLLKDAFVERSG
ncbi:MAG: ATP-binding protein [Nitrospirae bacterium CG_4_10_14_3_um_filter_44_29]|nr:ATP-binding protein [Nitrospirota bacterium]OIO29460.1 MAG: ATP-binding protein [Nitrospirae bacterium CG1_02_44_142]PIP69896.1 MAG: ATP-binding protein [Nitrospirae bacterium CG22_combo_CG10-13_8_21_14_all_44_11]PIV40811.1 MAG: ATP-binding protein [Nitrospirae bacterium CG02_land_8_20_14_3_00_44_33]PIV66884.1 MAG: ATP-binding protein [Nitrospirae bacterium CG01_land_8_20_14_3_00_44_22]PIW89566.1 MAG: ATP-binding protein [Nitrospirae bacterium CG_4_8_14_3_um_filter_44_28]PIX87651.1 MAG: AT